MGLFMSSASRHTGRQTACQHVLHTIESASVISIQNICTLLLFGWHNVVRSVRTSVRQLESAIWSTSRHFFFSLSLFCFGCHWWSLRAFWRRLSYSYPHGCVSYMYACNAWEEWDLFWCHPWFLIFDNMISSDVSNLPCLSWSPCGVTMVHKCDHNIYQETHQREMDQKISRRSACK